MNLIKFCEKTFERGGAVFSLPLGEEANQTPLTKLEDTAESFRFTDIDSINHYVKRYVLEHIDQLVDHDNYLNSYLSKRKLYLFISKTDDQ